MTSTITETELLRHLGDVLARIRYRRESFIVVERNGRAVAQMLPIEGEPTSVREALEAWLLDADASFADDLARVNAADRPAASPWVQSVGVEEVAVRRTSMLPASAVFRYDVIR